MRVQFCPISVFILEFAQPDIFSDFAEFIGIRNGICVQHVVE